MTHLDKYVLGTKTAYSLKSRFFAINGNRFEIIGGESTGKGANDVTYYLKDEKGNASEVKMDYLIKKLLEPGEQSKNQTR